MSDDQAYGSTSEEGEDQYSTTEFWAKEFAAAKKWFQKFHALARKVEKSYLLENERDGDDDKVDARYNLFWSNVQTLLSAMYGRMPKVEVDRTNLDPLDDIARVAGLILERIFNLEFTNVEDSPYYTYQEAILDRLVAGMGIAWARYEFTEDVQTIHPQVPPVVPGQLPVAPAEPVQIPIITDEMAPIDYVNWEDFLYSPCKRWQDKRWISRRVPMCKEEVAKRFDKAPDEAAGTPGVKISDQIPYGLKSKSGSNEDPVKAQVENQADIWEIWHLTNKCVYWYVPGYPEMLDHKEDPLQLAGFWPCKRPLVSTLLPKKFLPRPDFLFARSQYAELNMVVQRCQLLTEALKVVGVYDKTAEGVQRMLGQASINQLIPIDNWAMFAEKGGIKGAVDWFPLDMVVTTLDKLVMRKASLVQEVYEILGISDIQRGMASSRETATTQKLKAHFGSARTDKTQNEVARFITDNTRLRAEIICKHWQPDTILARSQIDKTVDAQYAQEAIQMLKSDPSVVARITVSADTIAAPDWDLEKQQRIDFLQAISQFIGMAMPIVEKDPGAGPYIVQIMQWAATGFKGAKQIEGVLDQMYQALVKQAQVAQAKPKQPSPEDEQKLGAASKSRADARQTNLETAMAAGIFPPPVPPAEPGMPPPQPGGMPPQSGMGPGMVPPASIPPTTARPQTPSVPSPKVP